ASFSEKADAATYLSSLDTQTASNIKAASSESNNNQNVAVNNTNANSVNAPTGTSNSNENNSTAANNVATNSQKNASKNNSNNNQTGTNNLTANSNHANNTNTSTDNSTVNNSTANNTNNTTQNTTTISLTDTFEASQTPVYSANNPIPINPPLPNGVYFKVQVGAFRNKISQDLFKGMKPVIGETTPQGFIRYSAGMFTATDKANDAKNKIVAMGYKDAFVVAFINGKRVSMDKALAALNQPITANNNNQNATNSQNNIAENASNAAVSTDVVQVKGLFYTVQVGVYLRPVAASRLFNIQPLYSEKTANGFIRYNSGIFNDFDKATAAKNIIVNIGIKDAFVTAYYNGKRINPDKAKALIIAGSAQYTSDANVNEMPNQSNQANVQSQQQTENQTSVVTQPTTNPVTQTTTSTNTTNTNNSTLRTTTSDNKVVFKVQIGAYKNQIPLEIANKFLTLGGDGVKTNVDENGITIYTTGSFSAFNDAEQLKNKIVTEGIPDAFVTAFSNGKKITLDEAQKLIH
ncbi:MAG TPA: hypothetical protein VNG53_05035, partial [Bacteroidia bacterium]|nr:hypothetical protein [Bacteroidia bacterium]